MTVTQERTAALDHFAAVFSDDMLHAHIGPGLTCTEADALAGALTALGRPLAAQSLLLHHANGDDEDDDHYIGGVR